MKCILCDAAIGEKNNSREHLIPNAIGGRRKVKGILCEPCNNTAGHTWDSELADQLNSLCLLFNIKRERGVVPSHAVKTTGGEQLTLHADGSMTPTNPKYKETVVSDAQVKIEIMARSMSEAKKMLAGVKRKYPKVDLNELIGNAQSASSYPADPLHFSFSFGGELAGRSLVKSALTFAVVSGVSADACANALAYLKNKAGPACFGYFYDRDVVTNRPKRMPFHCVAVSNIGTDGQLLGYVEIFGVQRMVVLLAERYAGSDVHSIHAINPTTGKQLGLDVDLALDKSNVRAAFEYKCIPDGAVEKCFGEVLPVALETAYEREKDRVLKDSVEYAFKNCGAQEGELLTQAHIDKVGKLMTEKLKPFLIHQITQGRKVIRDRKLRG